MELRKISRTSMAGVFNSTNDSIKCKILVVGPPKGGKTALSNFLGEYVETGGDYRPTKGVRIVEFDSNDVEIDGEQVNADIAVWDCGGDGKYRDCWAAMREGTRGVILVADPEKHTGDDLLTWYDEFVLKAELSPKQVMIVLMEQGERKTNDSIISDFILPTKVSGCRLIACNVEHDGESIRLEFNTFLVNVLSSLMPWE